MYVIQRIRVSSPRTFQSPSGHACVSIEPAPDEALDSGGRDCGGRGVATAFAGSAWRTQ